MNWDFTGGLIIGAVGGTVFWYIVIAAFWAGRKGAGK